MAYWGVRGNYDRRDAFALAWSATAAESFGFAERWFPNALL